MFVFRIKFVIGVFITDINRFSVSKFKPKALKLLIISLGPLTPRTLESYMFVMGKRAYSCLNIATTNRNMIHE